MCVQNVAQLILYSTDYMWGSHLNGTLKNSLKTSHYGGGTVGRTWASNLDWLVKESPSKDSYQ